MRCRARRGRWTTRGAMLYRGIVPEDADEAGGGAPHHELVPRLLQQQHVRHDLVEHLCFCSSHVTGVQRGFVLEQSPDRVARDATDGQPRATWVARLDFGRRRFGARGPASRVVRDVGLRPNEGDHCGKDGGEGKSKCGKAGAAAQCRRGHSGY
jgi:hypothetical protein